MLVSGIPPLRHEVSLVGFRNHINLLTATDPINLSLSDQYAFTMPRDGVITHMAVYFSLRSCTGAIGGTSYLRAQLFSSPTLPFPKEPPYPESNDNFMTVDGTLIDIGPIDGLQFPPKIIHIERTLEPPISFKAGTRFIVVVRHDSTPTGTTTLSGVLTGSLVIRSV